LSDLVVERFDAGGALVRDGTDDAIIDAALSGILAETGGRRILRLIAESAVAADAARTELPPPSTSYVVRQADSVSHRSQQGHRELSRHPLWFLL